MFFNTYIPSPQLAPYIRSYWILESDTMQAAPETIIPDGCMELIFHYGDAYTSNIAEQQQHQTGAVVIGQIKQAITIQPSGHTRIFSVRFQPWGFYALSGIHAHELSEQVVDATAIWGSEVGYMMEQVKGAAHTEKITIAERFFINYLNSQKKKVLYKTRDYLEVLTQLHNHKGNIAVSHMAYASNNSIRNFSRSVTEITGLSPKHLSRIIRLQNFLQLHTPGKTLTDTLYQCGYFDQAHFIREFKEITNMTPNKFFKEEHVMAKLMIH